MVSVSPGSFLAMLLFSRGGVELQVVKMIKNLTGSGWVGWRGGNGWEGWGGGGGTCWEGGKREEEGEVAPHRSVPQTQRENLTRKASHGQSSF